jgi:hypothetical protein
MDDRDVVASVAIDIRAVGLVVADQLKVAHYLLPSR